MDSESDTSDGEYFQPMDIKHRVGELELMISGDEAFFARIFQ